MVAIERRGKKAGFMAVLGSYNDWQFDGISHKYPEISYRKFCTEEYSGMERKQNQASIQTIFGGN